ncbi:MAG TPA: IclR family transcriptional regulator [Marinobacter sp.]|nr:IclR family transcriptional regulator [Marinobacter sp.]
METVHGAGQDERRQGGIQVIARAAAIMRVLGDHPDGLSLAEIARAVGLPRSTIQRIIAALEAEGFVEMIRAGGGYHLGPELGRLLYHTRIDVISVARPLLEELSEQIGETLVFCGVESNQVLVIERVVAERELRVVPAMGIIHVPFHTTAVGKALLASMDDSKVEKILRDTLPPGPGGEQVRRQLYRDLAHIRKIGLAEDYEEYMPDIAAFAIAMDTYLGRFSVAAIVPVSRARAHREKYITPLKAFKAKVEARIGES